MSWILQVFYSLLSAVLFALAIPNEFLYFGSPLIGLFSLVPLYIAINSSKSHKETFFLLLIHAGVTHTLSSFWLSYFQGFAIFTLGASCLGTGLMKALTGMFFYYPFSKNVKTAELREISGQSYIMIPLRVFWFSSLYTAYEWIKSTGFLAYPWGTLSMTSYNWPLIKQIADITGVYGITFIFALFSACFGESILCLGKLSNVEDKQRYFSTFRNNWIVCAVLFIASTSYGFYAIRSAAQPMKHMNAVLVQQNKDPWTKDEDENILRSQRLTEKGIETFKQNGKECDLVVWSEAVLLRRFPEAEFVYNFLPEESPLIPFIERMNTPFVIGAPLLQNKEKREFKNSALLFDKKGKWRGSYSKMHLVPFAELIPGRKYEIVQKTLKKLVGFSYGWTPGEKITLFDIPVSEKTDYGDSFTYIPLSESSSVKISTPICFDDSANEVCRAMYLCGSEVFVNLTNDSWSKTKSAEIQHFVVAHFRAIEYRTTLVRSTNAGCTAVIDNCGRTLASLPLFEEGFLPAEIPVYPRQITLYARYGNWLPELILILMAIFIIFNEYGEKKDEMSILRKS